MCWCCAHKVLIPLNSTPTGVFYMFSIPNLASSSRNISGNMCENSVEICGNDEGLLEGSIIDRKR